jgi:acetyl esterase
MLEEASRQLVAQLQQPDNPPLETQPIETLRAAMDALAATDSAGPSIARVADFSAVLPHGLISVRLYHPSPGERLPVLVYFHGGGWVAWNVQALDPVCRRLSDAGEFAVVSVEYRLAPEHRYPAAVDDAYAVLGWVRSRPDLLGIDPERMGVAGDSAGGNLAAVVARLNRDRHDPPLQFQGLIYPVTDATMSLPSYVEHASDAALTMAVMQHFVGSYLPEGIDRRHPDISPLFAPDVTGLPPALVIVAEYDPLRDDGLSYARRLREAGVPVQVEHFAHSMHGFLSLGGLVGPESGARAVRLVAEGFRQRVMKHQVSSTR